MVFTNNNGGDVTGGLSAEQRNVAPAPGSFDYYRALQLQLEAQGGFQNLGGDELLQSGVDEGFLQYLIDNNQSIGTANGNVFNSPLLGRIDMDNGRFRTVTADQQYREALARSQNYGQADHDGFAEVDPSQFSDYQTFSMRNLGGTGIRSETNVKVDPTTGRPISFASRDPQDDVRNRNTAIGTFGAVVGAGVAGGAYYGDGGTTTAGSLGAVDAGAISTEAAAGEIAAGSAANAAFDPALAGGAGSVGSNFGGGGATLGGAGNAAATGAGFNLFDPDTWSGDGISGGISDFLTGGGDGFNLGNLAGLIGANYDYQARQRDRDELREMFRPYREGGIDYMNRLNETYDNPNSYLEGPEHQAIQNTVHNQISRADASRGHNANSLGRQAKLQELAMTNLGTYRSGLSQTASNLGAIATGANSVDSIYNTSSPAAPVFGALEGMYGNGGNT